MKVARPSFKLILSQLAQSLHLGNFSLLGMLLRVSRIPPRAVYRYLYLTLSSLQSKTP